MRAIGRSEGYCNACFTGVYPIGSQPGECQDRFREGDGDEPGRVGMNVLIVGSGGANMPWPGKWLRAHVLGSLFIAPGIRARSARGERSDITGRPCPAIVGILPGARDRPGDDRPGSTAGAGSGRRAARGTASRCSAHPAAAAQIESSKAFAKAFHAAAWDPNGALWRFLGIRTGAALSEPGWITRS